MKINYFVKEYIHNTFYYRLWLQQKHLKFSVSNWIQWKMLNKNDTQKWMCPIMQCFYVWLQTHSPYIQANGIGIRISTWSQYRFLLDSIYILSVTAFHLPHTFSFNTIFVYARILICPCMPIYMSTKPVNVTTIPRGLTARIAGFHPAGPGSTPGVGTKFLFIQRGFILL